MKVYYCGKLIPSQAVTDTFKTTLVKSSVYKSDLNRNTLRLNVEDFNYLRDKLHLWLHVYSGITDDKLIRILDSIPNFLSTNFYHTTVIVYEIVEDVDGNKYGKELITGLLFPLYINPNSKYFYGRGDNCNLELERTFTNTNIARFKYILKEDEVASINIVNEYLELQGNKGELNKFKKNITQLYNENVFKNEIILKDEEPLEKENEITKIMEDIEFILNLLKQYNRKLYIKHYEEYNNLCSANNDTQNYCVPNKKDYLNLLSNIKLSLLTTKENCDNVPEYLNNINIKYFNKIINNEISINDININDVENIYDMFLKSKDKYSVEIQRDILKKLALLYVLVVKTNMDNINEFELENSYFKNSLKSVILQIDNLLKLEILDGNVQIDFSKNPNIKDTLEIIKNIEFNKLGKENIKKLIR